VGGRRQRAIAHGSLRILTVLVITDWYNGVDRLWRQVQENRLFLWGPSLLRSFLGVFERFSSEVYLYQLVRLFLPPSHVPARLVTVSFNLAS
jgi:hypothetical protein